MNWPEVVFESLYAVPSRNGTYKPKEFHGRGCRIVNMGELFGFDFISDQEMERLEMTGDELAANALEAGDLLFGRRSLVEAGAGKCSIVVAPPEPLTFESSIIRVRLTIDEVNPRFYFYYFKSPQGRGRISSIVSGTNVKGIRGSDLKKLSVPLPPKDTQNEISSILSAYDDLIENNRRRMALLEESARLLYREWFVHLRFPGHARTRVTDGVPKGWQLLELDKLAGIVMGQSPESKFYNETGNGLPFHQGVADFGDRFVSNRIFTSEQTRIAKANSILCSVRAPVGRLNITLEKIAIGRGLAALNSRTGHQSLLMYQLRSHFFKEDLIGSGSIFASVAKKELFGQKLLTPTTQLADKFEELSRPIDNQLRVLHLQNQRLRTARDLLLPRLMSGEIEA